MLLLILFAAVAGVSFLVGVIAPAKEAVEPLLGKVGEILINALPKFMESPLTNAFKDYISSVHFLIGFAFMILSALGLIFAIVRKKPLKMIIMFIINFASIAALVCSLVM